MRALQTIKETPEKLAETRRNEVCSFLKKMEKCFVYRNLEQNVNMTSNSLYKMASSSCNSEIYKKK